VLAVARNVEKAKKMLGDLPIVTIVKGDFEDEKSLDAALAGVNRAMLVSGVGKHEQHDVECDFLLKCNPKLVSRLRFVHSSLAWELACCQCPC